MKKKLTNKNNGAVLLLNEEQFEITEDGYYLNENYLIKQDWELSDYEEKPPLYYIRGDRKRSNEVIKMLREKVGKDKRFPSSLDCNSKNLFYFIGITNEINVCYEYSNFAMLLQRYGTELHLPEPIPQTIHKSDDVLDRIGRIEEMLKEIKSQHENLCNNIE